MLTVDRHASKVWIIDYKYYILEIMEQYRTVLKQLSQNMYYFIISMPNIFKLLDYELLKPSLHQ